MTDYDAADPATGGLPLGVNFDARAERFRQRIYGTSKGQLRLELVWRDLSRLLAIDGPSLRVWDAGGGMGQMSGRLAAAGHRVLLSDVSTAMLKQADDLLAAHRERGLVELRQGALQEMAVDFAGEFDLVLCHAVLEWLVAPAPALAALMASVRSGGTLSLLIYNEAALMLKRLRRGQWQRVLDGKVAGLADGRGLTPPSPLRCAAVVQQLQRGGFEVLDQSGIRCAYDWLPAETRETMAWSDLLALEQRLSRDSDFLGTARYLHICARRA